MITYTITVTSHGASDAPTVTWHDPMNGTWSRSTRIRAATPA